MPEICNCKKDCKCPQGFECCSENAPKGKALFGLCVKSGTCDTSRGICSSGKKSPPFKTEKIVVNTEEGYCTVEPKNMLLIFILVFFSILIYLKYSKK